MSENHSHAESVSPVRPRTDAMRTFVAGAAIVGLLVFIIFLWYSSHVILLIFAGILIAILLRGLSDWVSDHTRLPHAASLAIVMVVLVGTLVAVCWLSAPRLVSEVAGLADELPRALGELRHKMDGTRVGHLILSESPKFGSLVGGTSGDLLGNVTGVVSTTLGVVVSLLVVLFTGLFLAINPRMYVRGVIHLVPPDKRDRAAEVLGAIGYTLKWWMIGQSIDMLVIGVATALGLWLLGVPLAMALGFFAGLFNFIPNFGPFISLVPAVLLTLPTDPTKAMYVVLLFLVLQNLEGYVLMPFIQGRASSLPGAVSIIAQVLMGVLAGGLGLTLAAPLAAATIVAVKMLYVEDTLGDRIRTPADGAARAEVREVQRAAAEVAHGQK